MVDTKNTQLLSDLLKTVSDTTRRSLLTTLTQEGASRVTDLANHYDMSLNAVSKHIKILKKSGLVKRKTMGRTHWIEADLAQFTLAENWFASLKSTWDLRLEKLDQILSEEIHND